MGKYIASFWLDRSVMLSTFLFSDDDNGGSCFEDSRTSENETLGILLYVSLITKHL